MGLDKKEEADPCLCLELEKPHLRDGALKNGREIVPLKWRKWLGLGVNGAWWGLHVMWGRQEPPPPTSSDLSLNARLFSSPPFSVQLHTIRPYTGAL